MRAKVDYVTRWLALGGILTPVGSAALVVYATLLTPGYDALQQSISALAGPDMPYTRLVTASFVLFGLIVISLAWALLRTLGRGASGALCFALLVVNGLAVVVASLFYENSREVVALTVTAGLVHAQAARTSLSAMLLVMLLVARAAWPRRRWRGFCWFSIAAASLMLVFSVLFELPIWGTMAGLFERVAFGTEMLWVMALSLRLFRPGYTGWRGMR